MASALAFFARQAHGTMSAVNACAKGRGIFMKVCIIKPAYSTDYSQSDALFAAELRYLRECDESMDNIVMPASCDCPALAKTKEQAEQSSEKYNMPAGFGNPPAPHYAYIEQGRRRISALSTAKPSRVCAS